MELKNIRIKSYRTIGTEQFLDLSSGLTVVGPNNTGKTNILKAIQLLLTGHDNIYRYDRALDLTFESTQSRTSLVANFEGNPYGEDKDIYSSFDELHEILGTTRDEDNQISLNLQFSLNSIPSYQFFPNTKKPQNRSKQTQFSVKQKQLVSDLLSKFICHYIPSEKGIKDLYFEILVPSLRSAAAKRINSHINEIKEVLDQTAGKLNKVLEDAGIKDMKAMFSIPNDSLEDFISGFDFKLQDPSETSIFRKGMGVQSTAIISSFLWISEEEINQGKKVIWLLEEPESYLHPELSFSCEKILKSLQKISLVVKTTHSLAFVPSDPKLVVGTELMNKQTKVNTYRTYFEATKKLRKSLGVRFSDYFNLSDLNVFLEGETDREYFSWFLEFTKNIDSENYTWTLLRSSELLDFGGISQLTGFLRATYEFISKERVLVCVFDGDEKAVDLRKQIQHYFGNKNISFQPDLNFISVRKGFSIEGLFPDEWIIQAHEERPNWFTKDFSVDAFGTLESFGLQDLRKRDFLSHMCGKAQEQMDMKWADGWVAVCNRVDEALLRTKNLLDRSF